MGKINNVNLSGGTGCIDGQGLFLEPFDPDWPKPLLKGWGS